MKPAASSSPSHVNEKLLALYASGDLPLVGKMRVRHHVWHCSQCENQVAKFRASLVELRSEASSETLTACEAVLDWSRLESEMHGNIAVGVAAARCIDNVGRHRSFSRGALIASGLAALFVAGWFTHIPPDQNRHLFASLRRLAGMEESPLSSTIVQTTPTGIAVRSQGATLTLRHPSSAIVSLSGNSGVTARYLDENTGQVTITKVYGQ